MSRIFEHPQQARAITGGKHHFFGYYDKFPWDATGRYHLALEVDYMDRMPEPDDAVTVGMIDLEDNNRFVPLDTTTAWHWQQGAMLQWWGAEADRKIVYNIRDGDTCNARIRDINNGETRDLPRAIYHLTAEGSKAVCLNFSRIHHARPGYGYNGIPDRNETVPAPEDDGVWVMDMHTGESTFIISLAELAKHDPEPEYHRGTHYINHAQWNQSGTRFLFFHLWNVPADPNQSNLDPNIAAAGEFSRLYTMNADGSDRHLTPAFEMVSHYDWLGDDRILAFSRVRYKADCFYLYHDREGTYDVIGRDVMPIDGHCSMSPDGQWMLNDTYPQGDPPTRTLFLYNMADGNRHNLGHYTMGAIRDGPMRCDLHPRWSRDGRQVSFDSVHEGSRQIYVMDVSSVVG